MDFNLFEIFIDHIFWSSFSFEICTFGFHLNPTRSLFSVCIDFDEDYIFDEERKKGWYLNIDLFFIHIIRDYKL